MKKVIFLISWIFLFLFFSGWYSGTIAQNLSQGTWMNKAFSGREFIENRGQYSIENNHSANPVLFGVRSGGIQIYFTSKGLTYRHDACQVFSSDESGEEKESKEDEEEGKNKTSCESSIIQMEWQNSNPVVKIITAEPQTYYYTYPDQSDLSHKKTLLAHVFKKIIYKDLYPGIDVEYIFHETTGIKYSLVVHPGADISKVQMKYSGAENVFKDEAGNIRLVTKSGDIIDHAPQTFYEDDRKGICSAFHIKDNNVSFDLGSYDREKTIVIDPWVTNPSFAFSNKAYDIGTDAAGNIYVCGSDQDWKIEKFNSAGVPQWTYVVTGWAFNTKWYGDFTTDPAGNSYVSDAVSLGINMYKINTAGALVWSSSASVWWMSEEFALCYNPAGNVLVVAGAMGSESVSSVDPVAGGMSAITTFAGCGGCGGNEIRSITRSPCGNFYSISGSLPGASTPGFVRGITPAYSQIFSVGTGYNSSFNYTGPFYKSGSPGNQNAIAASNFNVYTYDGTTIMKRNINTGALVSSVSVFSAIESRNSGITLDSCENVYVGTLTGVVVYDKNLNFLSSAGTGGPVYDVRINVNNEVIACGDGFVQSFGVMVPCVLPVLSLAVNSTTANCGSNNGSATAVVSNGIAPFTFSWSNGQTNSTLTGVPSGTYTVTVSDASCPPKTITSTVVITNVNGPAIGITQTNVNCGVSGSAAAAASGGTSPYAYTWNNGSTNATLTGLVSGTYTVTTTDNTGCISSKTVTIINTGALTAGTNIVANVNCGGTNTGSALASATGATGALTYTWSNGQSNATATGLVAGIYTVSIKDGNGCTGTATVQITEPPVLTNVISSFTNVKCSGGNDGSITVNVSGGTSPYIYSWSNGQTIPGASGLSASSYSFKVTDSKGCTASAVYNVAGPPPLAVTGVTITNTDCGKVNSGAIYLSGDGGTPFSLTGYNYSWSNGTSSSYLTNVPAATYTVKITDANGCTVTASYTVGTGIHPLIDAGFTPFTNTVCLGSTVTFHNTGSSGAGYSHTWYITNINSSLLKIGYVDSIVNTFNVAGKFIVMHRVTNNPCDITVKDTITVVNCVNPLVTAIGGSICPGACASVTATGTGGASPYSFSWSNGASTQNISPCPASTTTYTVKITDSGGLTSTATAVVTVFPAPTLTTTPVNVSCKGGSNGTLTANPSGGTSPYAYSWSNSQTSQTATGLAQNNYTVLVTDSKGCTITVSTDVAEPTAVTAVGNSSAAACGSASGTATVAAGGGVSPFTYLWSNGSTTQTISGLIADPYTVTVTDANNCTNSAVVPVSNSPSPAINNLVKTDVACNGDATGTATVSASGGAGSLTYSWSNGVTGITAVAGLKAGTYAINVTDASGCTAVSTITITEPPAISQPVFVVTDASCGQSNGAVTASSGGGTGTLTYTWNTGVTGTTISNTPSGIYTITVKDGSGCIQTKSVSVGNGAGPAISGFSHVNVLCKGDSSGTASVTINNGTAPYVYSWNTGATASSANFQMTLTALKAGTYSVTITDGGGCTTTGSVSLTEPLKGLIINGILPVDPGCLSNNGSATASASGGAGTITYHWSTGASGPTASNLSAGTYILTVTDSNGCSKTQNVSISNNPAPSINNLSPVNVLCKGGSTGSATVSATGTGNLTYSWSNAATGQTLSNVPAGTYSITVTDGAGCKAVGTVIISEPASALIINTISTTNAGCGKSDGSATAAVSGGTGGITYNWSSGGSAQTESNLSAAIYTLTVTDGNGCTTSAVTTLANTNAPVIATSVITSINCNAGTGSVQAAVTGGASPYSYSWSNSTTGVSASTTITLNNITAAVYTITITDANNCVSNQTITITAPAPIKILSPSVSSAHCGSNDGSASVAVPSGGTSPYSYSWTNGQTSRNLVSVLSGNYALTVTDSKNCISTVSVQVNNFTPTVTLASHTNVSCNGASDGSALLADPVGGVTPYSYSWSNGLTQTTISANGLKAGVYTVTVKDSSNCQATVSVTITEPSAISTAPVISNAHCGSADGSVNVSVVNGGSSPYSYSWSGGQTSENISGVSAGTYVLTIKDSKNCTGTFTAIVNNIGAAIINVQAKTGTKCNGSADGTAVLANPSGGTAPYTYSWSNGFTSTTVGVSGLSAATYTVIVKDANNCQSTASVTITQPAAVSVTTTFNNASCIGINNGKASANVSGGNSPYTYSWSNNKTVAAITGLSSGTYSVTVTDQNNCSASKTVQVGNNGGPKALASADTTITQGASVHLSASGGTTFNWTPPTNLSCTSCPDPIATPGVSTWYLVTVKDLNGCSDEDSVYIKVEPPCGDIFIPTAFSPNGDGVNDLFCIRGKCINNYSLQIFDRWGELLFESTDITRCWDGTFNGKILNTAVFVFQVRGSNAMTGKAVDWKGNVTLVR